RQGREFHIDLLHVLFAPRQRLAHEGTQHRGRGCERGDIFRRRPSELLGSRGRPPSRTRHARALTRASIFFAKIDGSPGHKRVYARLRRAMPGNDGGWLRLNGPWTYNLVSLPLAMTGPVGCPVGDPPGGSSDTASAASAVRRPARSGGMVRRIGCPGWMSPSERGRWLGRISHSSMARGSLVSSVAGTTTRLSPVAVTAATKFGWPLVPASVAISGVRVAGTSPI